MIVDRHKLNALARRVAIGSAGLVILLSVVVAALWGDRPQLSEIDWQPYPTYESRPDAVTVTWLGVTTLLFDDGDTQILIDGFFSRPSVADILFSADVKSSAAQINRVLDEYRMRRLAAIIPVHSHFDHAMDIGAIANRSSASIIGSDSTANIARGSGVPEDQIVVVEEVNSMSSATSPSASYPRVMRLWDGAVRFRMPAASTHHSRRPRRSAPGAKVGAIQLSSRTHRARPWYRAVPVFAGRPG